jgi:two-component system chemotaxis sensor kinase CheA
MATDPYKYFRIEARSIVEDLGRGVLQLEKGVVPDLAAGLLRLAHTLKGAARVVKQSAIAEAAHAIEDALAPLRTPGAGVPADGVDRVLKLLDAISAQVATLDLPGSGGFGPTPSAPEGRRPAPPPAAPATAEPATATATATAVARPEPHPEPNRAAAPAEELGRTVRVDVTELDALLEEIAEAGVRLRARRRRAPGGQRARQVADLLVRELAPRGEAARARARAGELQAVVDDLERHLADGIEQSERQMQQVRDTAERLRLLPVRVLFGSLERTARDVAQALSKRVVFEARGGDVRTDAQVLSVAQGALIQMVRNAVAHGIEPEADRARTSKPPDGRVEIEVVQRGNKVTFLCRDDGRGVDVAAVVRVARSRGVLPPTTVESDAPALDAPALLRLLLHGGITTSPAVTELSGRGVGLDILREAAERLGGEVTLETRAAVGTTLALTVPISLSSLDALMVESGGVGAAIPLDAIRRTVRLAPGDVARTADGESIVHEGKVIPFISLTGPLRGQAAPRREGQGWTAVVIDGGQGLAAIGVDRLRGASHVVVRPLPAFAPADRVIAGAAIDGEGTPQLVLDPDGLVASAVRARPMASPAPRALAAPILVIDDSLTTRMLEQSILESAGYEVDLATSAEEAMEKARRRPYRLFLVDVEMPGMDGFTFVERTRADPVLRNIPAILVTSRHAPEDRQRGADVGAAAYIVKGDFDQGRLLETLRSLVGT